jgi:cobalt-zinc-cadmium efflux system membrane fusion protein
MHKKIIVLSKIVFLLFIVLSILTCSNDEKSIKDENQDTISNIEQKNSGIITLTNEQQKQLKIETRKIDKSEVAFSITAPAFVFPAPLNFSVVSAPVQGRIVGISVHEGEWVKKGDLLLEIESLQFGNLIAEYLQARAEENYQKNRLERIESLVEKKISSKSDLEKANADYIRAKASANASYSKLKAVGIKDHEIESLVSSELINPRLKIYSEIAGIMDQHLIDMGQSVNEYDKLATLINPSKVLVKGYVNPTEGSYIKAGDKIKISLKDHPQKSIDGRITSINPALDEVNKSIVVNTIINTKDSWPRPGENVRMEIESVSGNDYLVIPLEAVAYNNDNAIVFVKIADEKFQKRIIEIAEINAGNALVKSGLEYNEEIAISQVFSLKALYRYEEFAE